MKLPTPIGPRYPLILASASQRRQNLLRQVGIPFRALPSGIREGNTGEPPEKEACLLAEAKARKAYGVSPGSWILGADTLVVLGERVLVKPRSEDGARDMLGLLSGREHEVITGFVLLSPEGDTAHREAVSTRVQFRPLSTQEIKDYVRTGEPFGKAGSYAIQGVGAFLVEGIVGSYTNVVGLPLCALIRALVNAGALRSFPLLSRQGKGPARVE